MLYYHFLVAQPEKILKTNENRYVVFSFKDTDTKATFLPIT